MGQLHLNYLNQQATQQLLQRLKLMVITQVTEAFELDHFKPTSLPLIKDQLLS
jgi:hypothetical protein